MISMLFQSLIVRDDMADNKFIELAKKYPQICHLPMGEAALIDSNWIITAGHVGNDLNADLSNGYTPTVKCNGSEYKIEKVIVHPEFRNIENGLSNDIALIKIKGVIQNISPVKIYKKNDESGKIIILVGMGDMGNGKTGPQKWDKLTRAATNKIDTVDEQWVSFTFDPPASGKATEFEGISGPGDSGGPAFVEISNELFIIGISSHQTGQQQNGKGKYGVMEHYTRISSYAEWIAKTMSSN
jgi:secreted trypsin-like serine protease